MKRSFLLAFLILASAWPGAAGAQRIFYRSGTWLEASPSVQRLSLLGVLQAWERLAESVEEGRSSLRQREALRLHDCLTGGSRSTAELLEQVTAFSLAHPDRVYYSLTDFIAEGLKNLCSGP